MRALFLRINEKSLRRVVMSAHSTRMLASSPVWKRVLHPGIPDLLFAMHSTANFQSSHISVEASSAFLPYLTSVRSFYQAVFGWFESAFLSVRLPVTVKVSFIALFSVIIDAVYFSFFLGSFSFYSSTFMRMSFCSDRRLQHSRRCPTSYQLYHLPTS